MYAGFSWFGLCVFEQMKSLTQEIVVNCEKSSRLGSGRTLV
jgi:hypothetical protein